MPKKDQSKLLTEVELELMNIIWQLGGGTVKDVIENLPQRRKLAYTSVSTILRILEQKKILESKKNGRVHIYKPLIAKKKYEAKTLKHMVNHVFGGTAISLAKTLIDSKDLSDEDIKELKTLLDERLSL